LAQARPSSAPCAATQSVNKVSPVAGWPSARAKLEAIEEQARQLAALRCKLRRLVRLCEHGDGDDCVALRLTQTDLNGKER
jgi:hypothetical protein